MRDINGKLRWPLVLVAVWLTLMVTGVALAVTLYNTSIPSQVTIVLAPTPTPTPTPTHTPTPTPAPSLSYSPASLDFGQVIQGQVGAAGLTLTNTGNVPLTSFGVALDGSPVGVALTATGLPTSLDPGQSQAVILDLSVAFSVPANTYPFQVVVSAYY